MKKAGCDESQLTVDGTRKGPLKKRRIFSFLGLDLFIRKYSKKIIDCDIVVLSNLQLSMPKKMKEVIRNSMRGLKSVKKIAMQITWAALMQ